MGEGGAALPLASGKSHPTRPHREAHGQADAAPGPGDSAGLRSFMNPGMGAHIGSTLRGQLLALRRDGAQEQSQVRTDGHIACPLFDVALHQIRTR